MARWYPDSDRDRLAIFTEDLAQDGALLAERGIRLGAAQEMGHQVRVGRARPRSGLAQAGQRRADSLRVPLTPCALEPVELPPPGRLGDLQQRNRQALG